MVMYDKLLNFITAVCMNPDLYERDFNVVAAYLSQYIDERTRKLFLHGNIWPREAVKESKDDSQVSMHLAPSKKDWMQEVYC